MGGGALGRENGASPLQGQGLGALPRSGGGFGLGAAMGGGALAFANFGCSSSPGATCRPWLRPRLPLSLEAGSRRLRALGCC